MKQAKEIIEQNKKQKHNNWIPINFPSEIPKAEPTLPSDDTKTKEPETEPWDTISDEDIEKNRLSLQGNHSLSFLTNLRSASAAFLKRKILKSWSSISKNISQKPS